MNLLTIDEKLHLEKIKLSYAGIIFNAIDQDRKFLSQWLPFVSQTKTIADTEAYIQSIIKKPYDQRDEVYTIWYRNEFAGLIGLKDTDRLNEKTEIGYWMIEKMQGKGIMTRSVSKLIDYAFRNLNMNRIQIKVAVGNLKSAAIPKRLGFQFEGIERDGEKHTSRFFDLEIFSFLKKDWINSL